MLSCAADAQQTKGKMGKSHTSQSVAPSWGQAHNYQNDKYVYFPDYYTFYSPGRGYTYWNNGNWMTSQNLPSNMSIIDMNNARTQTLDVPLNTFPERNINTYMNQYPAQPVNGTVLPAPQSR